MVMTASGILEMATCDRELVTSAALANHGTETNSAYAELWWKRLYATEATPVAAPTLQPSSPRRARSSAVYQAVKAPHPAQTNVASISRALTSAAPSSSFRLRPMRRPMRARWFRGGRGGRWRSARRVAGPSRRLQQCASWPRSIRATFYPALARPARRRQAGRPSRCFGAYERHARAGELGLSAGKSLLWCFRPERTAATNLYCREAKIANM